MPAPWNCPSSKQKSAERRRGKEKPKEEVKGHELHRIDTGWGIHRLTRGPEEGTSGSASPSPSPRRPSTLPDDNPKEGETTTEHGNDEEKETRITAKRGDTPQRETQEDESPSPIRRSLESLAEGGESEGAQGEWRESQTLDDRGAPGGRGMRGAMPSPMTLENGD